MERRDFLTGVGAAALASPALAAQQAPSEDVRLQALLDRFWDEMIDESPETATGLGLDVRSRAHLRTRLSNYSAAGRAALFARTKGRLGRLRTINRGRLSTASQLDYDVVSYSYGRAVDGAERFRFGEGASAGFSYAPYSPYVVSQLSGPYQALPDFLDSKHPVETLADGEAYLARLRSLAGALDDSTATLRAEAGMGILAPDFLLEQASGQLAKLAASDGLASGFATKAAAAGIPGDWQARAQDVLNRAVRPAAERQQAAVDSLRKGARHDAGVWRLPDGEAYYAGALAFQTTTDLKPEDAHTLGRDQVQELTGKLDSLLRAQGLTGGTVTARLVGLNNRADQLYANTDAGRAEILAYLNGRVADVRARLPRVFTTLPKAPMEIVRVPPSIEDGAANGYAQGPSLDGKRPGRFYINLKDTHEWPRFSLHPGLPRGLSGPSMAGRHRPGGHRDSDPAASGGQLLSLWRGLGALCRAVGRRTGRLRRRPAGPHRLPAVDPVPRRAAGGRHRDARQTLEPRKGHRLHGRGDRAPARRDAAGNRPLLRLAGTGLQLQGGPQ